MFVAGPYRATFNGVDLGVTQRGFELEHTFLEEIIQGDHLGESAVDSVYLGGDVFVNAVLQEADLNSVRAAIWPFSTVEGRVGRVGRTYVDVALPLVLTVLTGSRAATAGPNTITLPLAVIAGGNTIRRLYGSHLRNIPMRWRAYPRFAEVVNLEPIEFWYSTT
jgi:hypothetical protein